MRYPLMACLLLLNACEPVPPVPKPPRPALTVMVGEQTRPAQDVLIGEVRSRYETAQGFRVHGKIVERLVEVGTRVDQGQILARLDPLDSRLAIQAAQADVATAEAERQLAQSELSRYRQLYERHFVSSQALEVQEARAKAATARIQQVKAQAKLAENQSAYSVLQAESAGVITEIHAEPGQVVAAGETIVRLASAQTLEIAIAVPESRMDQVATGAPVEVRFWAHPQRTYSAKVREIAPAADSVTRTFQVRVALEHPDHEVRLGMTAGVRFQADTAQAWLLPLPAVTRREGRDMVWVFDPATQQVQVRAVTTTAYREDGVLISEGLQAGEQVVVAGTQVLVPGMTIRPIAGRSQ